MKVYNQNLYRALRPKSVPNEEANLPVWERIGTSDITMDEIYDILKPKLKKGQLLHITLHETSKNSAEYGDWD